MGNLESETGLVCGLGSGVLLSVKALLRDDDTRNGGRIRGHIVVWRLIPTTCDLEQEDSRNSLQNGASNLDICECVSGTTHLSQGTVQIWHRGFGQIYLIPRGVVNIQDGGKRREKAESGEFEEVQVGN